MRLQNILEVIRGEAHRPGKIPFTDPDHLFFKCPLSRSTWRLHSDLEKKHSGTCTYGGVSRCRRGLHSLFTFSIFRAFAAVVSTGSCLVVSEWWAVVKIGVTLDGPLLVDFSLFCRPQSWYTGSLLGLTTSRLVLSSPVVIIEDLQ